ncbi:MAG: polysaccharide deacetylase family protein [Desulfurella sp.]|uniref:polysaccharide deacetylase family protein n=1 Tax=Desulfurella sp. TaxID=1962857 RepID=UPI003D0E49C4
MFSVPVLLYHHINYDNDVLSISPEVFEEHLKYLKQEGYVSIDDEELAQYMIEGKKDWQKAVVITFDDGYLDTWVWAYPLLKKYGFKALLFLVTWNVEEEESLGFNLDDVYAGKIQMDKLPKCEAQYAIIDGFKHKVESKLCWSEVRFMDKSGIIKVLPHSKMHQKVYASDKIIGYNRPREKLSYFGDVAGDKRYGTLDFDRKPEFAYNEFIPDKDLNDMLHKHVLDNGYLDFFKKENYKRELDKIVENYRQEKGSIGVFETDEQRYMRVLRELKLVKGELETEIKRKTYSFAWPWGAYDEISIKAAKEAGFKYLFTTKTGANIVGSNVLEIKRFRIWKSDLSWFKTRLQMYSNPLLARVYSYLKK